LKIFKKFENHKIKRKTNWGIVSKCDSFNIYWQISMCDFVFFSKRDSWKPPTYQTKLTSFEKNCHILRRSLNLLCMRTQLWFHVCSTTKYDTRRKATVFFCKIKNNVFDSWNVLYCCQIENNTIMYFFYRALPCLILNQCNNKIPKVINTITNYRKLISATYTRTKTRHKHRGICCLLSLVKKCLIHYSIN
jgi:hypothetical protein